MLTDDEVLRSARQAMSDISKDDSEWKIALMDAVREIAGKVEIPELQSTKSITGSTAQSYDLPTELGYEWAQFDRVIGKPYWDKYGLDLLNKSEFDGYYYDSDCKGTPQFYIIFEGELRIAPQPSSAKTIYFPFQKLPTSVGDIPDRYKDVVITFLCRNMLPTGTDRYMRLAAICEAKVTKYKGQIDYKPPAFEHNIMKQKRSEILTNLDRTGS